MTSRQLILWDIKAVTKTTQLQFYVQQHEHYYCPSLKVSHMWIMALK